MSEMPKDPVMLLSWLNMKLRDQYEDLADLCYDYHIPMQEIVDKMEAIGYHYTYKSNQSFINHRRDRKYINITTRDE